MDGEYLNYTLREPIGVVGMITAWNYPMLLAAWKVAVAHALDMTIPRRHYGFGSLGMDFPVKMPCRSLEEARGRC